MLFSSTSFTDHSCFPPIHLFSHLILLLYHCFLLHPLPRCSSFTYLPCTVSLLHLSPTPTLWFFYLSSFTLQSCPNSFFKLQDVILIQVTLKSNTDYLSIIRTLICYLYCYIFEILELRVEFIH